MNPGAPFDLHIRSLPPGALRVVSFRARERMSRPYVADVIAACADIDDARLQTEVLGSRACLWIHGPRGARALRGVIARSGTRGAHLHDRTAFELRIVPRLAMLSLRKNSRIFQDRTTPEIVAAILDEAGIAHRFETKAKHPPRGYCVQYEETDLEFIHRLLAETGLFYSFEHAGEDAAVETPEVVLLRDGATYAPIEGDETLVHRVVPEGSTLQLEEHHVIELHRTRRAAPARLSRRDYDFLRPLSPLLETVSVAGAPGEGEVYEHHGEYAESEAEQRNGATALEQLRRKALRASGKSVCPRLGVGRSFRLAEHELPSHDGEYVTIALDHEGRSPEIAGEGPTYRNRFSAIPADSAYRPARRARQFRQVLETATVTGPANQEIYTDALGRIKVQFHWDREGERDERSSCFLRVAQAWAGSGWGFQFVPRIGMEVLVGFLGGDPDRPVVVGVVPNATHPVPYPLPENRTKSGIKTESTPGGGGFNEILFDDEKGGEVLSLRAERNLVECAQNNHLLQVGNDQTTTVAGDRSTQVKGADSLLVQGRQIWTVNGPSSVSVGGGASASIAGRRTTGIAGDDMTRVGGGHTVMAATYSHLIIGHGGPEGQGLVVVNGEYRIGTTKDAQVTSQTGIKLMCGESTLEILPSEIKLKSPKLTVIAGEELFARGKEHEIALGDHLEIRGEDVRLLAKGSQLLLNDDATLSGRQVMLNGEKPKPGEKDLSESEEKGTITFRVKPHFEVAPGDKLVAVIATPTGEVVEREVDANMEARLEGRKGDRFTLVDVRKGELPVGKRGA